MTSLILHNSYGINSMMTLQNI